MPPQRESVRAILPSTESRTLRRPDPTASWRIRCIGSDLWSRTGQNPESGEISDGRAGSGFCEKSIACSRRSTKSSRAIPSSGRFDGRPRRGTSQPDPGPTRARGAQESGPSFPILQGDQTVPGYGCLGRQGRWSRTTRLATLSSPATWASGSGNSRSFRGPLTLVAFFRSFPGPYGSCSRTDS